MFPFGWGLSYTTFSYTGFKTTASGHNVTVSFTVRNTGKRAGDDVAQIYVSLPAAAGEPPRRLVGWQKIRLNPGESKTVSQAIEPLYLSIFDETKDAWQLVAGEYTFHAGGSSRDLPLSAKVRLDD